MTPSGGGRACLLASMAGKTGMADAIATLRKGAGALDAVETCIRPVETDPAEHSVGVGGAPNVLGEVELDASIMDGHTLQTGAVGALQGFLHPISVARQVMERLPHVMLTGEGAARFGREIGAEAGPVLTPEAEATWHAWLEQHIPADDLEHWQSDATNTPLAALAWRTVQPETIHGTVVVLTEDRERHFAGGVSTSGWSYKYPGRLGDSPIIGAGLYVDDRFGAAGCVGHGELAIRAVTARSVVLYMKMGASVQEAVHEAAHDLRRLKRDFESSLAIHALNREGQPYMLVLGDDPGMRTYHYWTEGQEPAEVEGLIEAW
jgi:L-asparaginase / beta-aspartyl-peptidase